MKLQFDAKTPIEVVRTNSRKSASIKVENGKVSVLVPDNLDDEKIRSIVSKKHPWIRHKLFLHSQHPQPKPKEFLNGETFSYLGRNYRLKIVRGSQQTNLRHGFLEVGIGDIQDQAEQVQKIKKSVIDWYTSHARLKFREKAEKFQSQIGVTPARIQVRDFSSRWGSCTDKGNVSFNWRIIMCPSRIIDYVVVHELCHLIRHDHSDVFWGHVRRVIPDFEQDKEWLKMNSRKMFLF